MDKKVKILIILIFCIIIITIAIIINFLYKNHNINKYEKYDEIISFSNNENQQIVFYNINDNSVAICYYKLYPSKNKVNQNTFSRYFSKDKIISYDNFNSILNKISNILNTKWKIYENKVITYGGEKILINSYELEKINNIIDSNF